MPACHETRNPLSGIGGFRPTARERGIYVCNFSGQERTVDFSPLQIVHQISHFCVTTSLHTRLERNTILERSGLKGAPKVRNVRECALRSDRCGKTRRRQFCRCATCVTLLRGNKCATRYSPCPPHSVMNTHTACRTL